MPPYPPRGVEVVAFTGEAPSFAGRRRARAPRVAPRVGVPCPNAMGLGGARAPKRDPRNPRFVFHGDVLNLRRFVGVSQASERERK